MNIQLPIFVSRFLKYIFLIGALFLPLFFWPWSQIPYEIPKVDFVFRWVEILAVITVLDFPNLPRRNLNTKLFVLLISWLFVAVVSSLMGVDWVKSLFGNYYRKDGLVTLFHLVGFTLIVALNWREEWKTPFSWIVNLGSTLAALSVFLIPAWPDGSRGGVFGQPNFLAGYLLVCLPFTFYVISKVKGNLRMLSFLTLFIQIVAILLTYSYVSILGVLLLVLIWLCAVKKKIGIFIGCVVIALVASLGVGYLWWTDLHSRELVENPTLVVAESRERIYTKVILGAMKRPWFGYGIANVDYAFAAVDWPIKLNNDVYVDKAHSHILEMFSTTGMLGLFLYLTVLLYVFVLLIKKYTKDPNVWNIALLSIFVLYVFQSQTNITSIAEEIIFWFICALCMYSSEDQIGIDKLGQ